MKINKYTFDNGKYEIHSADDGSSLVACRHGEFWQNMIGDNLTAAMLHRIDDLEQALQNLYKNGLKQAWMDKYETDMIAAKKALENKQ
jgi:hypothetical protein